MFRYFMFAFVFLLSSFVCAAQPVEFVVVVTSYNNGAKNRNRCLKNLESIRKQTYPYFTVLYVDDCSIDDNGKLVDEFVAKYGLQNKFTIIHNAQRQGKLKNQYDVIHQIAPHKVIVEVDGDDALSHQGVLDKLASVYADDAIWCTWGSYRETGGRIGVCAPFPQSVIQAKSFRSYPWVTSALKTYYARLFQLIKKEDLQFQGRFIPDAVDFAIMYPMVEMAANGHFKFIKDILYIFYVYNHGLYFGQIPHEGISWPNFVRSRPVYPSLEKLF